MKTKAHTIYKTSDGKRVKSVTTLINAHLGWNKQILVNWAKSQGLAGNDPTKVMNEAAEIGTLAHLLCENFIKKEKTDLDDYSKNQIKAAELCFEAFKEWDAQVKPKYIESEIKQIDDDLRLGGTCDLILEIDGKKEKAHVHEVKQIGLQDFIDKNKIFSYAITSSKTKIYTTFGYKHKSPIKI